MTTDPLSALDVMDARAEAATYFGGETQEVAEDGLTRSKALRAVLDVLTDVDRPRVSRALIYDAIAHALTDEATS